MFDSAQCVLSPYTFKRIYGLNYHCEERFDSFEYFYEGFEEKLSLYELSLKLKKKLINFNNIYSVFVLIIPCEKWW